MKQYFSIITILFVVYCNAQNLEIPEKNDTLYVYFNHSKHQEKKVFRNLQDMKTSEDYYFYFKNENKYSLFTYNSISKNELTKRKAFLREQEKNIFDE